MITKTVTKNTSLENFLSKVVDEDYRTDFFTQRKFGWKNEMVNELVRTVLTDDYIPPIILCEENLENGNIQTYIADGIQRSTSLIKFRYENHKISAAISNPIITYSVLLRDENGRVVKDEDGNQIREEREFDLKGKTYNDLPKELQNQFDNYQIGSATHLNCSMHQIAEYVKRYNNHISMKTSQVAFTFLINYAEDVRRIMEHRFFLDGGSYTDKEHDNGDLERVIAESVMLINHKKDWKKSSKPMFKFLNENSNSIEFENFENLLDNLLPVVDDDRELMDLFTSKDSFLWFDLFDKFTKLNIDNLVFKKFLHSFIDNLSNLKVDSNNWCDLCSIKGTKDTKTIKIKTEYLYKIMVDYLIEIGAISNVNDIEKEISFMKKNVSEEIASEDLEFYKDILQDLLANVNEDSKLLDDDNILSLLAIVAYATINDIDLDEWIITYFNNNDSYINDQRENYLKMKNDLENIKVA